MRVLLLHPEFPETFWSFGPVLELVGRRALNPPLGLITVAALLPAEWELRLVDCAVRAPREEEWRGVDLVMLTGMIVQHESMLGRIAEAHRRGLPVVVGGPYATSAPETFEAAGADYLVLDEAEISLPPFLARLAAEGPRRRAPGAPALRFDAGGRKPELDAAPVRRFDLLEFDAYDAMSVQYSRGCPFLCEFCDIITLYGRRPRTKSAAQMPAELDALLALGWRGGVFLVDDNFIGNKPNVKRFLPELRVWQERRGTPFWFDTEASFDLAADPDLVAEMVACNVASVFIGIETPDEDSPELTKKRQNTRAPMLESIDCLTRAGLRVMCGMILGFDGEKPGAGRRITEFSEAAAIPTVLLSLLQVLPNTGLHTRLAKEGRLTGRIAGATARDGLNFVPTRPEREILAEYVEATAALYDPEIDLERCFRHFARLGTEPPARAAPPAAPDLAPRRTRRARLKAARDIALAARAFAVVAWRQGLARPTQGLFWRRLGWMLRHRPARAATYLAVCAHLEHLMPFAEKTAAALRARIAELDAAPAEAPAPAPRLAALT